MHPQSVHLARELVAELLEQVLAEELLPILMEASALPIEARGRSQYRCSTA